MKKITNIVVYIFFFLCSQLSFGQGIKWNLVNPYGIQMDDIGNVWNAGRVVDLLVNKGDGIIAASETSGVWLITRDGISAISLSRDWENPDVQCLAFGPDNDNHIYAGCSNKTIPGNPPVLYVTDVTRGLPLLRPWKVIPVPAEVGGIYEIAVLAKVRRIALACDGGIYWSPIPKPGGIYQWTKASDLPDGAFFGVAAGPKNTIMVSAFGSNVNTGLYGIFYGSWRLLGFPRPGYITDLAFHRATINGFDEKLMGRTTIASFEPDPFTAYALSVNGNGTPNAVLHSIDGGKNWAMMTGKLNCYWSSGPKNITNTDWTGDGQAGGIMHRITISKTIPTYIAFGYLHAFYSRDGGMNWNFIGNCDWHKVPGFHTDVHKVYFDNENRFILASDGGLAMTPDFGSTVDTRMNRRFANLQWYSTFVTRNFYGRFDVSYQIPGLLGGGLQDNGNVFSLVEPMSTPWKMLDGGDGGAGMFIRTGNFIRANLNDGIMWYSTWNPVNKILQGRYKIPIRDPRGLMWNFDLKNINCDIVNSPQFKNAAGQLMYLVGSQKGSLFGLFANPDGTDPHWEMIASWIIPEDNIGAIASAAGRQIFLSTGGGPYGPRFWRIAPSQEMPSDFGGGMGSGLTGKIEELGRLPATVGPLPGEDVKQYHINRIFCESDKVIYALCNNYQTRKGAVVRTEDGGKTWQKLPGLPDESFYGLETDWTVIPNTIFVCTDKNVYRSSNSGKSWESISAGLPVRPHCADLSFVTNPDGKRYLYLSTYGWSVWRTEL